MTTYESFKFHHLWRVISVWGTFMLVNFLWYGIGSSAEYFKDFVGKCIWTACFAFAFTAIYNHAATWRPKVEEPHTSTSPVPFFFHRAGYSLFFSLMIFGLILAAMAFSYYYVSVFFIYVLDGFRGDPAILLDDAALYTQITAGGLVLELHAKQETSERRDG